MSILRIGIGAFNKTGFSEDEFDVSFFVGNLRSVRMIFFYGDVVMDPERY